MSNWYDVVALDRMNVLTGVYSSPNTTWTLPFNDDTLNCIVLGPDFEDDAGTVLTPASNSNGAVVYAGDYSAGDVAIGRLYPMTVELSRPYVKDYGGDPVIRGRVTMREMLVEYHQTGYLKLLCEMDGRSDRSVVLDEDPIVERGVLHAWFNGDVDQMTLYIENDTAKPSTAVALEYVVNHRPR